MSIQRYFWLGTDNEGNEIMTMTLVNDAPKELRIPHDPDLELTDDVYTNFVPITKEEVLRRQEGFRNSKNKLIY